MNGSAEVVNFGVSDGDSGLSSAKDVLGDGVSKVVQVGDHLEILMEFTVYLREQVYLHQVQTFIKGFDRHVRGFRVIIFREHSEI